MNEPWIKLFSKLTEWEWYKDQNTKSLFIHCLLKANWKDGKFEGLDITRGSFITSLPNLAISLGLTVQEVRTALKHLISTGEITDKGTNKYRVITIKNYDLYQQVNSQTNIQLTDNQQTTNRQLTAIEEYKTNRHIDNYVCNAYACEEFRCHLDCKQKTINCVNCMKKHQCPLEEEPLFKSKYGMSFYEYVVLKERKEKAIAMELEEMHDSSPNQELIDCDWLNGKYEEE